MRPLIQELSVAVSPESLIEQLRGECGVILLRSSNFDSLHARYSFVVARPFLRFTSHGSRCEIASSDGIHEQFGNPWRVLDVLMSRYELLDEVDLPFPLGGCFGYWGYDLKNFVEPKLPRTAVNDLELPDCCVGFYGSVVVFDHRLGKTWIVSTGLDTDGSRSEQRAKQETEFWQARLNQSSEYNADEPQGRACRSARAVGYYRGNAGNGDPSRSCLMDEVPIKTKTVTRLSPNSRRDSETSCSNIIDVRGIHNSSPGLSIRRFNRSP